MQYYGYPHGVLWTPACITLTSRIGLSEHWHGDPNRVLCVLTSDTKRTPIGTVSTHRGYCACTGHARSSHVEQSCELAVGVKCGMLTTAVLCLCVRCATRHGIGPGLYFERLVYRSPEEFHPAWDPTLVCDPPHGAQHGALGVSALHGAHAGTSSALTQRTRTRLRGRRVRVHTCA